MLWLPSSAYFTCLGERPRFQKHADTQGFEVTVLEEEKKWRILAASEV